MMSKVIASRIKYVLAHIIYHNQTGYIEDRFIGETIHSIYHIMDWTVKENIPSLMIFIDLVLTIVLNGISFLNALKRLREKYIFLYVHSFKR